MYWYHGSPVAPANEAHAVRCKAAVQLQEMRLWDAATSKGTQPDDRGGRQVDKEWE